ncbi:protein of unknown function [Methylocaldum szegediense]|uniref:Uncharacterized protein n=1 Tax=Methylocaldum szegediense TaxID=73780 RepID=A0ABM9I949_9GAMM|nr:protein of unknown function [Methylocaldum szegediense]CAI8968469.1 protein of unknown function [Methylocaldum szegediense]
MLQWGEMVQLIRDVWASTSGDAKGKSWMVGGLCRLALIRVSLCGGLNLRGKCLVGLIFSDPPRKCLILKGLVGLVGLVGLSLTRLAKNF